MNKEEKLKVKGSEKENTSKEANIEELDIESLDQVTGGSLRSTIVTKTKDISGDTASKV